ncbi:MAG: hypothetical protein PHT07_07360 [Paludibacter sp.]|nr:hypothetical protein [Paludibacter sp.]
MRRTILFTLCVIFITSIFAESPHGKDFAIKCEVCHTTDNWTKIKMNGFDHDKTDFPLVGQHKTVYCRKCHVDLNFKNAKRDCSSCHKDVHELTLGRNCERCHTPSSWIVNNIIQIHQQSRFPLVGAHAQIDCNLCHKSASLLRFDPMRSDCVDCHLKDYNATTNPNHVTSNFPKNCTQCHDQRVWTSATFDHNTTGFPLTGAHISVNCTSCHKNGFGPIPTTCVSCHLANFNATTNPNHVTAKFSTDCQTCHNTIAWSPSTFNHNTATAFPLTGAHIGVTCVSCHTNGYGPIPTTCVSCHLANFNSTTNPNHVTANFPKTCETCHSTTTWVPSTFNHSTSTSFPLTGAHIAVDCVTCHKNGYGAIPTTCVSCHLDNFNSTTNPDHIGARFSTECQTCHTTTAWAPTSFNHNTATSFPLTGAHITVACYSCHANGFAGIPTTCVSCHLTNYNSTTNPDHIAAKFSTDCQTCHTTNAWAPANFNHNIATSFPLTGAHIGVACYSCHANGFAGISTTCVSCHLANYNATTNPNHITAKFPTTCETCHTTTAWVPSTFNHSTATTFPLTGAHSTVTCTTCHPSGFAAIPTTCVSCHLANYNATTNPNHITAKFPTTCETCHTTTAWVPSTFNHSTSTSFPLTGAHTSVACVACHPTNYAAIPTTCVSCHLTNYNAATNPNHKANPTVFTTNCTTCHNTTAWSPAPLFNHTAFFPIASGRHSGISCATCHTNSANYAVFSCVTTACHRTAHNQNQGNAGCYSCHPTGRAG